MVLVVFRIQIYRLMCLPFRDIFLNNDYRFFIESPILESSCSIIFFDFQIIYFWNFIYKL